MNLWKISTIALTLSLGAVVGGSVVSVAAAHEHEHSPMHTALEHLKDAKKALESASHDHGGHRTKAVKATEVAIKETEAGIAFKDDHGGTPKDPGTPKAPGGTPKQ
jgi:hypothetical protein